MENIFDRLLRQIQGGRQFATPFAQPFQQTAPKPAITPEIAKPEVPIVPLPLEPTERAPEADTAPLGIPTPLITTEPIVPLGEAPEELVKEPSEVRTQRVIDAVADILQPKPKKRAGFWQKIGGGVGSVLSFVEKVDATSFGLVKGNIMAAINNTTLEDELGAKEGQSILEAARDYTSRHKTWERFLGEVVISPFNLIPVGRIIGGVGKGISKLSSTMARHQVLQQGILNAAPFKPLHLSKAGLRARVSSRVKEYTTDILSKPRTLTGQTAYNEFGRENLGIVRRLQAFTEGDINYLGKLYHNPKKWISTPEAREVRAYYQLAVKSKTNPLRWQDYKLPTRNAAQVEKDIIDSVLQAASPQTLRDLKGGFLYRTHRTMLRTLTPFQLLLRPAYTVNNQMMNMTMVLTRHPRLALTYLVSPKLRREVVERWGTVDMPEFLRQGFGHSYITGTEHLEAGHELVEGIPKAVEGMLPLLGKGRGWASYKQIKNAYPTKPPKRIPTGMTAKEYDQAVATWHQIPLVEKLIPGMRWADSVVRAVNITGEQWARSADYIFSHIKTTNHLHKQMTRQLGLDTPLLRQLSKSPNQLEAWITGQAVDPLAIVPRGGLNPSTEAILEAHLGRLQPGDTTATVLEAIKAAERELDEVGTRFRRMLLLQGEQEDIVRALNEQGAEELTQYGSAAGIRNPELEEFLAIRPADEVGFWAEVKRNQAIENEAKRGFQAFTGTPKYATVHDRAEAIYTKYTNRMELAAARAKAEVADMVDEASARGSELLQSESAAVYARERNAKSAILKQRTKEIKELYNSAQQAMEKAGLKGVNIAEMDAEALKMPLEDIQRILRDNGLSENLVTDSMTKADHMIDMWLDAERVALERVKEGFLENVDNLVKERFPSHLNVSDVRTMHNSINSYAAREGVRTAENDLFNYGMRTNLDYLASTLMPYPFWSMKFALHWGARLIDNPSQFNALAILMKTWQEESKDLPFFAMTSPVKLDLPDGSQVRFSPFTWFFPLGYAGMDILRYGDQANNYVDAVAAIQDFAGGYMFPTWEMGIALGSEFDVPGFQTRGAGIARDPTEIIRDIIPQTRQLRGLLSFSPAGVKWSLEHNIFTEAEINTAIYAIGDALNSGELDDIPDAEAAIQALLDRRPHPLALKYLSKSLQRGLQTGSARYMGLPVSRWYPEQQGTWQVRQLLNPRESRPPAPEVRQSIINAYPGIEVVRGKVTPTGLDRNQEKEWKASQEYFRTIDAARTRWLEDDMGTLTDKFENPQKGDTMSPEQFMEFRRELYSKFGAATDQARMRADDLGAPLDRDDRERFWRSVGRPVWPRHLLDDILDEYYSIEVDNFPGTINLDTDWQAFFNARESFFMSLIPWQRAWLEDFINDPSKPDAEFRRAQDKARKYWAVREMLKEDNPALKEMLEWIEYYDVAEQDMVEIFTRTPTYRRFTRLLKTMRESMRRDDPELDAVLVKYWGLSPITP